MCGICGQVRGDGRPIDRAVLETMCRAQEHRGPDSRGIHLDGSAGLGIQRLRVIDLETGDQPIYNEDRTIAVVLNGEIYNYRELREELAAKGHSLATKGDTEVIAHLYEDLGPGCVEKLHGMFAFALWDKPRRRLLVARDRIGKKPLFYSFREGALSFASELRSLMADPEVSREIDPHAIDAYLTYQYVPAPQAVFAGARKLPAGSFLLYEGGEISIERYWRLRYDRGEVPSDPAEIQEEIREQIRRAVRRRMISDVPLGAFLSGGIDSATVVAAMAEASPEPVRTFSIGFEESNWNELPNARLIAERFSTDHRELIVKPDLVSILPKIARHYGEPFGDSSSVPSFYVAEMARREVTVALNGDGGDESFAGYHRYITAMRAHAIATVVPSRLRRAFGSTVGRREERGDPEASLNRIGRLARSLELDDEGRYGEAMSMFDSRQREDLYTPEFSDLVGGDGGSRIIESAWGNAEGKSLVNVLLEVDANTYLPDNLLVKADIATMASSLEGRSPFLDHHLMEFAASLPGNLKLHGTEKKSVLRDALRGWIPDRILDGPKFGFGLPMVGEWFRGDLRGYISEVLTDPGTLNRGYFREDRLRNLLDRHLDGTQEHGMRLWGLMMLELWHRELVDKNATPAPTAATG
jgi:asparagine synthase (glutamine-hydrolysing)